jgi:hypothetical protein
MNYWLTSVAALAFLTPIAVLSQGTARSVQPPGRTPFIACGSAVPGKAGIVVVQLLDQVEAPGRFTVDSDVLDPQGLEWTGKGTIRIETNAGGHRSTCQASAPSAFHLRSRSTALAGSALQVLAGQPVLVELRDVTGRLLAAQLMDPASGDRRTFDW